MIERSKAQRAAEARYDQKRRGVTITLRLSRDQAAWLDARRKPGESRPSALRRLEKMPDASCGATSNLCATAMASSGSSALKASPRASPSDAVP